MKRIRTDFSTEQANCSNKICKLPEDCERCRRFVCNACECVVKWGFGAADDAPGLCDDCWAHYISPWSDFDAMLEKRRLKHERVIAGGIRGL